MACLANKCVLQVVAAEATPAEVRQAAAVNFKNHVKRHWNGTGRDVRSLSDDDGTSAAPIPDAEKVLCRLAASANKRNLSDSTGSLRSIVLAMCETSKRFDHSHAE